MSGRISILFVLLLVGQSALFGQFSVETTWSEILHQNVEPGEIDGVPLSVVHYQGIKNDPGFSTIITALKTIDLDDMKTKNEKLAFWINVYNIAAVKIIIDNYPVKSIRDIGTLLSPVWKKDAIDIGDRVYSLNHIEHEILRKMDEPRIHLAIVCASVSCPDLRDEAFSADKLDAQLDDQAAKFLQNSMKGFRLDSDKKSVHVSSIFKWFKKDFDDDEGILTFLSTHTKKDVSGYSIKYLPYNWNLNVK